MTFPLIFLGIFLGYSILQLLEYVVTVTIIPMKRFLDSLPSRIADSEQERQLVPHEKDDFQAESANEIDTLSEISLFEQANMGKSVADLGEEIKVIKQEAIEMKARMDSIATITLK